MRSHKGFLLAFVCFLLLSACSRQEQTLKKIEPFTFTNQDGQAFGSADLMDKVWIADFIFTKCESVCPPMTIEMANLQEQFNKDGIDIEFVSFTVDPTIDSPDVLKEYVQQFTEDESNWNMVSGYSQNEIEVFAREQFQTVIQKPKTSTQVIHSTNFFLVNKNGAVVKEYNYVDETYVKSLTKDILKLNK
ncbi:SCO family protein [Sporosarcina siberiensis]|uniref:SCO family protein n=1 Tax=Sporosarcina siberiensis TaxID=1365606 RepID=A0ABW4SDB4_9BACL